MSPSSARSEKRRLPVFYVALDALGTLILVLGVLGATGVDIGLPVLARIWPFLVVLGALLMAPFIVWAIRLAGKPSG